MYLQDERDAILKAYNVYEKALDALQKNCPHKTILGVAEGYEDNRRICEDCGYEIANPWGNSYRWGALSGRAYSVHWNEFYSARPKQTYISEEDRKRLGLDGDLSQDSDSL